MQRRFKEIRTYFGLSQAQFAQRIHKSPGFVSNVETGRSNVSEETICAICEAFGVNKGWLKNGSGEMLSENYAPVDKATVGNRIRAIRKQHDLTQQQFADKIGYSKMQIHFVEIGKVIPSNDFLQRVAAAFGVNYDWLLSGKGQIEATTDGVDERLISWLRDNPDVVRELRIRGGLD
jgi:transcriptional regulator with XRE-family HTH domain